MIKLNEISDGKLYTSNDMVKPGFPVMSVSVQRVAEWEIQYSGSHRSVSFEQATGADFAA